MQTHTSFPLRGKVSPAAFLLLLAAEAAVAALGTFLIPADPKNALLLGRSLSRWVMIAGLLLGALLLTGLGLRLRRSAEGQARLSALGYDPKGVDGKFGSGVRAAISRWQGDNGLAATGYLNAEQLARLRAQRVR